MQRLVGQSEMDTDAVSICATVFYKEQKLSYGCQSM